MSYCIQGNCIDRADTAGCNGKGWTEDVSYTLNTVDRPAVYAVDQGGGKSQARVYEGLAPTLTCTHGGEPAVYNVPLADVASTLRAGAGAPKHDADIKGRLIMSSGFKSNMGSKAHGIAYEEEKAPTLAAGQHDASVCIAIENHPNDSRVKFSEENVVQALTGRMGTGGGNTPMILRIKQGGT